MGSLYLSKFIWEVDVLKEIKSEKTYAVTSRINPEFELNKNYQMKRICLKLLPIIFCLLFIQQAIGKKMFIKAIYYLPSYFIIKGLINDT